MAICGIQDSILAYNPKDLNPHGYVTSPIIREYNVGQVPSRLDSPQLGQTFSLQLNDNNEPFYVETRRLLPASSMRFNVIYLTSTKSGNQSVAGLAQDAGIALDSVGFIGSGTGGIALSVAAGTIAGGVSFGDTKFAVQLIDSKTDINLPIEITKEILETGRVDLDNKYPLTFLGIFDKPLLINDEREERLGQRPGQQYGLNGPGSILSDSIVIDELIADTEENNPDGEYESFSDRSEYDSKNRFKNIVFDERIYNFRADSQAGDLNHVFSFRGQHRTDPDSSSSIFEINTEELAEGDFIYATLHYAETRRLRQVWRHKPTIFEGAQREIFFNLSQVVALAELDIWSYHISDFRVPKLNDNQEIEDNKVSVSVFENNQNSEDGNYDLVSGWRLSESHNKETELYVGTEDGIGIFNSIDGSFNLLVSRSSFNGDTKWYNDYLDDNPRFSNLDFEDIELEGSLFDVSLINNSLLTDQEKLPYQRDLAFAIEKANAQVGFAPLDLIKEDINVSGLDITSVVFKSSTMQSFSSSAFSSSTCTYDRNFGGFRDPNGFGNVFLFTQPVPAPSVFVDWQIATPAYLDNFNKRSRMFFEKYNPDGTVGSAINNSFVFVNTAPLIGTAISVDESPMADRAMLFFDNAKISSLGYHYLEDNLLRDQYYNLETDETKTHNKGEFSHDDFKVIGYNLLIGDGVSYNLGRLPSAEVLDICNNRFTAEYQTVTFEGLTGDGSVEFSFDQNLTIKELTLTINIDVGEFRRKLAIGENPDYNTYLGKKNIIDQFISIEFLQSEQVIDNISLPIGYDIIYKEGSSILEIVIDCANYNSRDIRINNNNIGSGLEIDIVKATTISNNEIQEYLKDGTNPSVVYDAKANAYVFYANGQTSNIDVLFTIDQGKSWFVNKDLIRLAKSETADLPYAIMDKVSNEVHLFYRVNNEALAVKSFSPTLLSCQDMYVDYNPPNKIDQNTDEDLGLEDYEEEGKNLRKRESYFVVGDSDSAFVRSEINIANDQIDVGRPYRFTSPNDSSYLNESFTDGEFSAVRDNRGLFRVFYVQGDGRLNVVASDSLKGWVKQASSVVFHKDFVDSDPEDSDQTDISNIQTFYNKKNGSIYCMYFHNDALYLRIIDSNLLYISKDIENNNVITGEGGATFFSESIRDALQLSTGSTSKPLFLVGSYSDLFISNEEENELFFNFTYPESYKELFNDDNFGLDIATKPIGYVTRSGLVRMFYKSSNEFIYGITLNGTVPDLDVQKRLPGEEN